MRYGVIAIVIILSASQFLLCSSAEFEALQRQLKWSSESTERADAAYDLAEDYAEESVSVLTARLNVDPSPEVREAIVVALSVIGSEDALMALVSAVDDPSPAVAATARRRISDLNAAEIERRMQLQNELTPPSPRLLDVLQWRTITDEMRKNGFPKELREPPPVFHIEVPTTDFRFAVLGDFGAEPNESSKKLEATVAQIAVADAIYAKRPFLFGITVGDNFYNKGLCSQNDPRWQSRWHDLYDRMKVPFFATLGNHDWYGMQSGKYCSAQTEIEHTDHIGNSSWKLPKTHYTFTAGPAQFFALDTDEDFSPQEPQRLWLADGLKNSERTWKIVYGHHPVFSGGKHKIESALKLHNKIFQHPDTSVDLYIAGHDHDLQHLREGNLHYLIVGGGGKNPRDVKCTSRSLFAEKTNGFAIIHVSETELEIELFSANGNRLHHCTLTKRRLSDGKFQRTDNCKAECLPQ